VDPRQANELTAAVQDVVRAWFAIPAGTLPDLEVTDKAITRLRDALIGMVPAHGAPRQKP
jgi:hypothetical protein